MLFPEQMKTPMKSSISLNSTHIFIDKLKNRAFYISIDKKLHKHINNMRTGWQGAQIHHLLRQSFMGCLARQYCPLLAMKLEQAWAKDTPLGFMQE